MGPTTNERYCLGRAAGKGPMFIYIGNESPLELYVNNLGFVWETG